MKPSFRILLRSRGLLPTLSVLMTLVLVFTQVFTCCRFNESLSIGLSHAYAALTHRAGHGTHGTHGIPLATATTHAGCHGHGKLLKESDPLPAIDASGATVKHHEVCLSEKGFTFQALQSTPSDNLLPAPIDLVFPIPHSVTEKVRVEGPSPQNKSSPPVYLLTRRLLV